MTAKTINVEEITVVENEAGQQVITANLVFPTAGNTKETIVYTVNGNGEVTVKMSVDATKSGMGNFLSCWFYDDTSGRLRECNMVRKWTC